MTSVVSSFIRNETISTLISFHIIINWHLFHLVLCKASSDLQLDPLYDKI